MDRHMLIDYLQFPKHTRAAKAFLQKPLSYSFYVVIRIVLSAVFIWSGIIKSFNPQAFAVIIESYGIIPDPWVLPAALCLSVFELLVGIGLMLNIQGALGLVTALLILFMLVLGYGLWIGLDVDCGCFSPQDPEGKAFHGLRPALYRDWVMLAAAAILFWIRRQGKIRTIKISNLYHRNIEKGEKIE
jgi:uncharacterized membrane protein YphA (DoxX/SURF4 family)